MNPDVECPAVKPRRLNFIDFFEPGRDPGFNGTLAQNFGAKRMDGPDMRLFESRQCIFKTTTLDGVHGSHTRVIEFDSQAQAKLAGSFACKRDGNDPINGRSSRTKNSNNTPDQFGRFPRARCRFDNQTLIERFSNPLPRRVVVLESGYHEMPRSSASRLSRSSCFPRTRSSS